MPASNYLDEQVLDWAFDGQTFDAAPTVYVALFTAAPSKAGGGTEVSGSGYARITTTLADWNVSGPPFQVQNVDVLTFATATGAWGTVLAFGLFDAVTGGNLLFFDTTSQQIAPDDGDVVVFNNQTLTVAGA